MKPAFGSNRPLPRNGSVPSNGHTWVPEDFPMESPQRQRPSQLVLFDFDGTITTKDTLKEFVRFYRGTRKYLESMITLSPILGLYALGILPNWKAKQYFLSSHFHPRSSAMASAR